MYSERFTVDHGVMGVNAYLHNIIVSILGSLWFHHKYAKKVLSHQYNRRVAATVFLVFIQ